MKKTLLYIFTLQIFIIVFAYSVYRSIDKQKKIKETQIKEDNITIQSGSYSGIIVETKE